MCNILEIQMIWKLSVKDFNTKKYNALLCTSHGLIVPFLSCPKGFIKCIAKKLKDTLNFTMPM